MHKGEIEVGNESDHELLIKVAASMLRMEEKFDTAIAKMDKVIEDHEVRIRKSEEGVTQIKSYGAGVMVAISYLVKKWGG